MVQTKDSTEKPKPHSENRSTELATILPSPRTSSNQPGVRSKALVAVGEGGGTKQQTSTALMQQKKAPLLPKPQWHAPWKLMRVNMYEITRVLLLLSWLYQSRFCVNRTPSVTAQCLTISVP